MKTKIFLTLISSFIALLVITICITTTLSTSHMISDTDIKNAVKRFGPLISQNKIQEAADNLQICYQDAHFNQPAANECIAADYSITQMIYLRDQGENKPYIIPFFTWESFKKRIKKTGISPAYILPFTKADHYTTFANTFDQTKSKHTGYSDYDLFRNFTMCYVNFIDILTKNYSTNLFYRNIVMH
ncbi:hypothetical protein [Commensalibacter communis]|uniref:hypothetical protein n=1 Tax=Commensalibacter communis TaxID=2972786 RepID=UPI00233123F7|nr:hypothetical protein [Commensalibacter communis]